MEEFDSHNIITETPFIAFTSDYSNTPTTQFPSFWNEDWLNLAIKELDTRHFTPEQLEQYMMMIAHNASAVENERLNILKARQEEKDNMVIKLHKKGLSNEEISNLLDFSVADIIRIISNTPNK